MFSYNSSLMEVVSYILRNVVVIPTRYAYVMKKTGYYTASIYKYLFERAKLIQINEIGKCEKECYFV